MKKLTQEQLDILLTLVNLDQKPTKELASKFLCNYYDKIIETPDYIAAVGEIPIALIAHMDTVFDREKSYKEVYYDEKQGVLWSPQGAGFDDKAGVAAIMEIVSRGYKPHIIFTTDEECGGIGAAAVIHNKKPFRNLKYCIELDRRGKDDCVFYDCDNEEFVKYVETFGFKENWGTFSDIGVICPNWGIAGVNLSIGYESEHTKQEILRTGWYLDTIDRVVTMLENVPSQTFKYVACKNPWKKYYDFYANFDIKCAKCGNLYLEEELFVVKNKEGKNQLWCPDCISKAQLNWCTSCFQAQETDGEPIITQECEECKKKKGVGNNGVQRNTAAV